MSSVLSPRPDTRYLVLDSALTLFTERGYFSTSVHDIGRAAGVSIGSIYHHFGDKEGIAGALYSQLNSRMESLIGDICRRHESAHDQARELIARLFELTDVGVPAGSAPEKRRPTDGSRTGTTGTLV